jgi:hypothetical protein
MTSSVCAVIHGARTRIAIHPFRFGSRGGLLPFRLSAFGNAVCLRDHSVNSGLARSDRGYLVSVRVSPAGSRPCMEMVSFRATPERGASKDRPLSFVASSLRLSRGARLAIMKGLIAGRPARSILPPGSIHARLKCSLDRPDCADARREYDCSGRRQVRRSGLRSGDRSATGPALPRLPRG